MTRATFPLIWSTQQREIGVAKRLLAQLTAGKQAEAWQVTHLVSQFYRSFKGMFGMTSDDDASVLFRTLIENGH